MSTPREIPVCQPALEGREAEYVAQAVRSGWLTGGEYLDKFECDFPRYVGARHGISTVNGTTALHLALAARRIGPGDEVIIPNLTMIATAFAVVYCGARPVFVDVDPATWNLDVALVEERISPRTRAIIPVHIAGHPVDMDPLMALARNHGLFVLEDAAEAHGAVYKGRKCGALAHAAAFSFYANKIITTGEGGMVLTDDDAFAERCRLLKNLSFPREGGRRYRHEEVGFNYRMTNVAAALGVAQLEKIEEYVTRRRHHAQRYSAGFRDCAFLQLPVEKPWARNVYWMYGMVLSEHAPLSRAQLQEQLANRGIETRTFFEPMHSQPSLQPYWNPSSAHRFPITQRLSEGGLFLPSGTGLTDDDIDYVIDALLTALRRT